LANRPSNHAAADLIQFNGFEQGLEITFTEPLVTLALNDLEENWPQHIGREYLKKNSVIRGSIDEYAALLQLRKILTVTCYFGKLPVPAVLAEACEGLEEAAAGTWVLYFFAALRHDQF
jgi:hypothetical protein